MSEVRDRIRATNPCASKASYPNEAQALQSARMSWSPKIRPVACALCGRWHLTTKRQAA